MFSSVYNGRQPTENSITILYNIYVWLARSAIWYKYNKKLGLASRIANHIAYETIANPETGEVFVAAGEIITPEVAEEIQNAGINIVDIKLGDKRIRVIGNGIVNIHKVLPNVDLSKLHFKEEVKKT